MLSTTTHRPTARGLPACSPHTRFASIRFTSAIAIIVARRGWARTHLVLVHHGGHDGELAGVVAEVDEHDTADLDEAGERLRERIGEQRMEGMEGSAWKGATGGGHRGSVSLTMVLCKSLSLCEPLKS